MPKVRVERRKAGAQSLKDETGKIIAGSFSVLGKSSNEAAEKGNPTRDPKNSEVIPPMVHTRSQE